MDDDDAFLVFCDAEHHAAGAAFSDADDEDDIVRALEDELIGADAGGLRADSDEELFLADSDAEIEMMREETKGGTVKA